MRIEIDQSGKLEYTSKPTVVGFADHRCKSIIILATEKQKLIKKFYKIDKPKVYRYRVFATLIYLLIKNEKSLSQITIDKEYPGQDNLIKSYLLNYLRKSHRNLDKRDIVFRSVGKASKAHEIAHKAYESKKADIKIMSSQIIKYLK